MELDLTAKELVEVKAPGVRLGHRGWVVDRFGHTRGLYAVQFADNCVGYFERRELEKVLPGELDAGSERGTSVYDIIDDLETRP